DFIRLLSNNPLQVEMEFLRLETHVSKNTPLEHLELFYKNFDEVADQFYDGLIVTGAPVEMLDFEEVNYWEEMVKIMDWARTHVHHRFTFAGLNKLHYTISMVWRRCR